MVPRALTPLIRKRLIQYPAVALVGPRQVGKTTLAKMFSSVYYDLEQPEERVKLDVQWPDILDSKQPIVLDEAQSWPEIFPRLRGAIDQNRKKNGRFLILGSISPALMKHVSESLVGRLALCELTPFLLTELKNGHSQKSLWLKGGYPDGGVIASNQFPVWQQDYLNLLAQRDLPNWGLPARAQMIQRLFKMLAISHGQVWNASQVGRSLGLTYHTVQSYLDYLLNAFLIRLLPPHHANIRKRLTKSPKLYWRDSGLLHALMGVTNFDELLSQPWVGYSWEGWVIEQVLSFLKTNDKSYEATYMRTNDGHELDLILDYKQDLWAFEIKLSASPTPNDVKRLNEAADLVKATKRVLISQTKEPVQSHNFYSTTIDHYLDLLS